MPKFNLDDVVIYQEQPAVIWDYSHRYKEYTLMQNGVFIRGVEAQELRGATIEEIKAAKR